MQTSKTRTPSYVKIQDFIRNKIAGKEYKVGDKIPSENELAKMFSVSRLTANKAIKELAVIGVLERIRGKGTFVRSDQSVPAPAKAFVSAMKVDVSCNRAHQLVQFRLIEAYPELVEKFGLTEDKRLYEIIRINKIIDKNESLDYTYVPAAYVGNLTLSMECLQSNYIHEFLRTQANLHPRYMKVFINTPRYSFLCQNEALLSSGSDDMITWTTDIYDAGLTLLATTITTYPHDALDLPLFTFSI